MAVRDQIVADIIANTAGAQQNLERLRATVAQSTRQVQEFRTSVETSMQRIGRAWASGLVAMVGLQSTLRLLTLGWKEAREAQEQFDRAVHGFTTIGAEDDMSAFASGLERAERAAEGLNKWLGQIMRQPLNDLGNLFAGVFGGAGAKAEQRAAFDRQVEIARQLLKSGNQVKPGMQEDLFSILRGSLSADPSMQFFLNTADLAELSREYAALVERMRGQKPAALPDVGQPGAPGRIRSPGNLSGAGPLPSPSQMAAPAKELSAELKAAAEWSSLLVDDFSEFTRLQLPMATGQVDEFAQSMSALRSALGSEALIALGEAAGAIGFALGSGQSVADALGSQMAQLIRQIGMLLVGAGARALLENGVYDARGWGLIAAGAAMGFGGGLLAGLINKGSGGGGMPSLSRGGGMSMPTGARMINITVNGSLITDDQLEDRILGVMART